MFLYFFRRNWRFEYKQNSRSGRKPSGRCLSESVDIFLTCGKKSGWSKHDVCDRRPATWMSPRAVPVRIRTATHFSLENSHPETLHRGRMFRSPWAFVEVNIKKIYVNIPVFTASTSYFLSRAVFH